MSEELTITQAIILGVIEGITEYLPISSTGHLLVAQRVLGIAVDTPDAKEAADAYAICIQGGAILAVLGLYWRHILRMANGLLGKDSEGRSLAFSLLAAFMPAAIIGLLANDWIKSYLFGMWPVVIAWIIGGVLLIFLGRNTHQRPGDTAESEGKLPVPTIRQAILIGLMQCVAMWPGTSRSLMAIVGALLVGMTMRKSVEFSFLLGVLTLGAATCYDALKSGELMLATYGATSIVVGFVASLISAAFAVKWLVSYLNSHGLHGFGYYRVVIGVVVGAALLANWLPST